MGLHYGTEEEFVAVAVTDLTMSERGATHVELHFAQDQRAIKADLLTLNSISSTFASGNDHAYFCRAWQTEQLTHTGGIHPFHWKTVMIIRS